MLLHKLSCHKGRLLLSSLVLKDADPNEYAVSGVDCVVSHESRQFADYGHEAFLGHLCHLLGLSDALVSPHSNVHSFSLPPSALEGGTGRPRLKLINVPSVRGYKGWRNFREDLFLGSSLSSDTVQRLMQICHEPLEDCIGDAPLEAPQRLLTGFALRQLLAVIGPAPNVRSGLAGGDHVQRVIELTVACQREPMPYHRPARSLHRRCARVGGKVGLVVGKRATLPTASR